MWNHYIGRQIRRCNRNLLLVNLLLIAVLLSLAFLTRRYLYNSFLGPFPMEHQALFEVKDPDELDRYYVTLKNKRRMRDEDSRAAKEEPAEEGFLLISDETSERTHLLLVKGRSSPPGEPISGRLVRVPDVVIEKLVNPLEAHNPRWRGVILRTVRLDTTEFRWPGYLGLALGVPLLLFAGWNVLRAAARTLHPEKHPMVGQLARLGPPAELASAIQEEVSRQAPHAALGAPIETQSWLLRPTFFDLRIIRIIPLNRFR
jgi:hypothetical protein